MPTLQRVTVFELKKKGNIEKPHTFWENYIHPNSSYEACCSFFGNEGEPVYFNIIRHIRNNGL